MLRLFSLWAHMYWARLRLIHPVSSSFRDLELRARDNMVLARIFFESEIESLLREKSLS